MAYSLMGHQPGEQPNGANADIGTGGALRDKDTILKNMKALTICQGNIMVAGAQLKEQQMQQNRDEPIRAFAAVLRGQTGVCSFNLSVHPVPVVPALITAMP
ncbi:hypothetical protein PoB_003318800 [Plakobranchus ocellatus]|uniref:Uncharacterized protein n=1 Tax=Plakobranchus ocellatus TaxID=259542 RepID=A0AAV4AHG1_9GAST|nr:hypothetical protein PoB_003318800 [Plakobranchus ocellatus]